MELKELYKKKGFSDELIELSEKAESELIEKFKEIDKIKEYNSLKVINAMQECMLSDIHFNISTGYGYNDMGREVIEEIYAKTFNTEDALVRLQMMSGTHALSTALSGNLRPGDELISATGKPYDTLEQVIGLNNENGSLKDYGISYKQVELLDDDSFDYIGLEKAISDKTKLITIQRSKGYDFRKSFTVEEIAKLIKFIKSLKKDIICMVDNCYGEFVDFNEPSDFGADMQVGSLIKNPGGGLAATGGYIVGSKKCVENAAIRLSSPGLGKDIGASLGTNQQVLQGFFMAPTVVAASVKGAVFQAKMFEFLGYKVLPNSKEKRSDIVQAIELGSEEAILAFCEGIQKAAGVDSYVTPIADDMPGYESKIIMACGAFIQGSSIELSADAPIKEPFNVFFQGGLTYSHSKLGTLMAIQNLINKNLIKLR